MSFRLKSAFCLNVLVSVALLAAGLLYISSSQIMPYHLQVIDRGWSDLDARLQIMFLGFLKLGGAGMLTAGIAIAVLTLIPFRRGDIWAHRAIPVIGLAFTAPTVYIAYSLHNSTGAATPRLIFLGMVLLLIVAYLLTIKAAGKHVSEYKEKKAIA